MLLLNLGKLEMDQRLKEKEVYYQSEKLQIVMVYLILRKKARMKINFLLRIKKSSSRTMS